MFIPRDSPAQQTSKNKKNTIIREPHQFAVFDVLVGLVMLGVATVVFVYYTAWTFLLPFIDEESVLQQFFLPREWAVKIPAALLVLGASAVSFFIGSVLIKSSKKAKAKADKSKKSN
ncbi:hypothetical protein DASC09_059610 [Saccharomycopsis crataegensis]|uniref:Dolichol phosphate-mannose biosynthesis regulatory protein n=1 Tax=Saccharomycopsis crataegensis TaxID=43959 RepID=A0AAV5QUM9_9ASCO|nr:hypothetical protein DASC09_059610 [Saccharomycopsis crataegensis]